MNRLVNLLKQRKRPLIIGMIHLNALPSSPKFQSTTQVAEIIAKAQHEAKLYEKHGLDVLMVENMHDVPYVPGDQVDHATTASMTAVCQAIRQSVHPAIPMGIQILAGANKAALAVAKVCDLDFLRVESFVFSQVSDEGWMDAQAGPLLRYRKSIHAEHISLFCDIKKKHSAHSVTSDVSLSDMAEAAEFFLADGVVLTGKATGKPLQMADLKEVHQSSCSLPVFIGSGVTVENVASYCAFPLAGFIIGSAFKVDGDWRQEVCEERVRDFMKHYKCLG